MVHTYKILFTHNFFPSQPEEMVPGICLIQQEKILLIDQQTGLKHTFNLKKPPVQLAWCEETDLLLIEEAKEAFFIAIPLIHRPQVGLTVFHPYKLSLLKKSLEDCLDKDNNPFSTKT